MEITRRTALGGALVAGAALAATPAAAAPRRTTYILAGHPDDDFRAAAYIRICVRRGDHMVLVALTDGGGSGMARARGWSVTYEKHVRRACQEAAWAALTTGTTSEVIRLGEKDGGARSAPVRDLIRAVEKKGGDVEWYACAHPEKVDSDAHKDHQAIVTGVKDAKPRVARFLRPVGPKATWKGTRYRVPSGDMALVLLARDCYRQFPGYNYSFLREMESRNYEARVTR